MSERGRSRRWDELYYYPPPQQVAYSDSGYHSTDTHKHRHKSHDHHHRHRDDHAHHHHSRHRGRSSDPVHHSHHRTVVRRHSYSLSPDRSRGRHRESSSRSTTRSSWEPNRKWKKGAEAAAGAAAVEMFRTRHEHGSNTWKAVRVATAALTAAAVETAADKHPESHDHRTVAESSIAGLLVNRIVNGSRHDGR